MESGIWVLLQHLFVESISYSGVQRSERSRKGNKSVLHLEATQRDSDDCFCILLA